MKKKGCKGCGDKRIAPQFYCNKCLIEKKKYLWCVITKIENEGYYGSRYDDIVVVSKKELKKEAKKCNTTIKHLLSEPPFKCLKPLKGEYYIEQKVPAFQLGEIFPIDPNFGREIIGAGRKPGKWFVEFEVFKYSELKKALLRAAEVLNKYYS